MACFWAWLWAASLQWWPPACYRSGRREVTLWRKFLVFGSPIFLFGFMPPFLLVFVAIWLLLVSSFSIGTWGLCFWWRLFMSGWCISMSCIWTRVLSGSGCSVFLRGCTGAIISSPMTCRWFLPSGMWERLFRCSSICWVGFVCWGILSRSFWGRWRWPIICSMSGCTWRTMWMSIFQGRCGGRCWRRRISGTILKMSTIGGALLLSWGTSSLEPCPIKGRFQRVSRLRILWRELVVLVSVDAG